MSPIRSSPVRSGESSTFDRCWRTAVNTRAASTLTAAGEGATTKRVHKETLTPLDATIYRGKERPGMHFVTEPSAAVGGAGTGTAAAGGASPSLGASAKPDPKGGCEEGGWRAAAG